MSAAIALLTILLVGIILSNYRVVCDVDPSDTASILMEQLRLQQMQLELAREQVRLQQEQISLLKNSHLEYFFYPVLASVASAALGYLAVRAIKRYLGNGAQNPETTALELMAIHDAYVARRQEINLLRNELNRFALKLPSAETSV